MFAAGCLLFCLRSRFPIVFSELEAVEIERETMFENARGSRVKIVNVNDIASFQGFAENADSLTFSGPYSREGF